MIFDTFCCIVTLQAGTAILASVCFVISGLSFGLNVLGNSSSADWYIPIIIISLFAILMATSGAFMFLSAYHESANLCYTSIGVLCVTALFWMVCTGFAMKNNPSDLVKVCIRRRCGESFWLAGLDYHIHPNTSENKTVKQIGIEPNVLVVNNSYETKEPTRETSTRKSTTTTESITPHLLPPHPTSPVATTPHLLPPHPTAPMSTITTTKPTPTPTTTTTTSVTTTTTTTPAMPTSGTTTTTTSDSTPTTTTTAMPTPSTTTTSTTDSKTTTTKTAMPTPSITTTTTTTTMPNPSTTTTRPTISDSTITTATTAMPTPSTTTTSDTTTTTKSTIATPSTTTNTNFTPTPTPHLIPPRPTPPTTISTTNRTITTTLYHSPGYGKIKKRLACAQYNCVSTLKMSIDTLPKDSQQLLDALNNLNTEKEKKVSEFVKILKRDEDNDDDYEDDDSSIYDNHDDNDDDDDNDEDINLHEKNDDTSQLRSTLGLVGVIFFFLVNLAFFIFAILILLCYAREIAQGQESSYKEELY